MNYTLLKFIPHSILVWFKVVIKIAILFLHFVPNDPIWDYGIYNYVYLNFQEKSGRIWKTAAKGFKLY